MNKVIKKFRVNGFVTLLIMVVTLIGCSSDIILEPLPTLLGEYEGEYRYITNFNQSNQQTKKAPITWRFSDQSYFMDDFTKTFCSPRGTYTLADNVELTPPETGDGGCSGVVGNKEQNPTGTFSIIFWQNSDDEIDSLVLTQQIDLIVKQILLIPAGN